MKLKEKDLLKIETVCLASTSELFASMVNPANRGADFVWENFPNIAKRLCVGSVLISHQWSDSKIEEVRIYATEYCEQLAKTYMQAAGLQ